MVSKDLFARVFEQCSRYSFLHYSEAFLNHLPSKLLEPAEAVNPSLPFCQGYEELLQLFRSSTHNRRWRNSELYPFLNQLNIPEYPALQEAVTALRIHVGLDRIERSATPRAFWRLRDPDLCVFQVSPSGLQLCEKVCVDVSVGSPSLVVFRPFEGLFSDLSQRHYYVKSEPALGTCVDLTRSALEVIERYSPELASGFCREVSTVGFMSARLEGRPKSFSLRNFYVGGIFVSISSPLFVAEQFIHEYYHQCIWPWWLIDEPPDMPRLKEIQSPVTGQSRGVPVMIQAALIYRSLTDFYEFVLSSDEARFHDEDILKAAEARRTEINSGLPELFDRLKVVLSESPRSLSLVEAIAQ